jgi:hypothetical protein
MSSAHQQLGRAPADAVPTRVVRALLAGEALAFALASLVHRGLLVDGYRHRQAYIAETVIATVLAAGLVAAMVAPHRALSAGIAAQAFALLGTAVGLLTIALSVGPRTVPDVVYHVAIVAVLAGGLSYAVRARRARRPPPGAATRPPFASVDPGRRPGDDR